MDFFVPNDEEIFLLTGEKDPYKNVQMLVDAGVKTAVVKIGKDGCLVGTKEGITHVYAVPGITCVDTTGAGDTFCASALLHVLKYGIDGLDNEAHLHELLTFANAAASLVTTKKGALCVMPTVDQVEAYIKESGR